MTEEDSGLYSWGPNDLAEIRLEAHGGGMLQTLGTQYH